MKSFHRAKSWLLAGMVMAVAAGCATAYYEVKDPVSGRVYYTEKLKTIKGGAVEFRDGKTGEMVTLQNSEVKKINKEEFSVNRLKEGTEAPPEENK